MPQNPSSDDQVDIRGRLASASGIGTDWAHSYNMRHDFAQPFCSVQDRLDGFWRPGHRHDQIIAHPPREVASAATGIAGVRAVILMITARRGRTR